MQNYYLYHGNDNLGEFSVSGRILQLRLNDGISDLKVPYELLKKYQQGKRIFNTAEVMDWVRERVVPSSRQNIDGILRQVGIEEYDELAIFLFARGKFNNDGYRLEEI